MGQDVLECPSQRRRVVGSSDDRIPQTTGFQIAQNAPATRRVLLAGRGELKQCFLLSGSDLLGGQYRLAPLPEPNPLGIPVDEQVTGFARRHVAREGLRIAPQLLTELVDGAARLPAMSQTAGARCVDISHLVALAAQPGCAISVSMSATAAMAVTLKTYRIVHFRLASLVEKQLRREIYKLALRIVASVRSSIDLSVRFRVRVDAGAFLPAGCTLSVNRSERGHTFRIPFVAIL
jgi:hypothetical protein